MPHRPSRSFTASPELFDFAMRKRREGFTADETLNMIKPPKDLGRPSRAQADVVREAYGIEGRPREFVMVRGRRQERRRDPKTGRFLSLR